MIEDEENEENGDDKISNSSSFFAESDKKLAISYIAELISTNVEILNGEQVFDNLCKLINPFQEQPHILGPHLNDLLTPLNYALCSMVSSGIEYNEKQLHLCCKVIQLICRVRGFKYVMKILPHEVNQIEGCLQLLRKQVIESTCIKSQQVT